MYITIINKLNENIFLSCSVIDWNDKSSLVGNLYEQSNFDVK